MTYRTVCDRCLKIARYDREFAMAKIFPPDYLPESLRNPYEVHLCKECWTEFCSFIGEYFVKEAKENDDVN